jgi:hypothetical protein
MLMDVVKNVSVPMPVSKPSDPLRVPTKAPGPPAGNVWKMVNVKVPPIGGPTAPGGTVEVTLIEPNEAPAGVLTASTAPVKVKIVVPLMFENVAMLVPLTLNVPVVVNVTGSAFAIPWLRAMIATTAMLRAIALKIESIEVPMACFSCSKRTLYGLQSAEAKLLTLEDPTALGLI